MRNATRVLFHSFCSQIALLSGVASAQERFTVAPSVAQRLIEVQQSQSDFLSRINVITVLEQEGDKVGVGVTRPIAGRTNTAAGTRRVPTPATDTSDMGRYRCEQTNFDTAIKYATLDAWAHKPEFQQLVRNAILKRQGLDRILIGWHGTSVAAQTDRAANPLLQDVNKGWLHKIRTFAPDRVIADGELTDGATKAVYVGDGAVGDDVDYVNLDALVMDAIEALDEWNRDDTELVVICGRDLVHDKYFSIVNAAGDKATEQLARDVLMSTKKIGGLPAVRVPGFPAGKLLITRLDNLSIYEQEGTRRRLVKDEPALDQIENYESVNEAYVVEDYGLCSLVENIVMGKKPA
ncbi:phage major capsid protein, P2 family [Sphingomonas sp.]|jgi:P2 family phage major capsid protein|uniref:phage major capsid protein, P2 family n=1 Tax=Sphingomonas sp. TaxID=28214 RepID=UPI0026110DBC|nr:phage major capsid protein, P2 family [Sphingomonas sp.]MDF2602985.1 putative capsid protein [Sphingomonas sp.]